MMKKKGSFLILSGLAFIVAALLLTVFNFLQEMQAAQSVDSVIEQLEPAEQISPAPVVPEVDIFIPDYILNPNVEMPTKLIDGQRYIGVLAVPSCNMELPIISEWSYDQLKVAPCKYSGSLYTNDLVLMAHNYQSHFAPLYRSVEGDKVIFTDMDGNAFHYRVVLKETLPPNAVEEMCDSDWDLTLFTCTVDGSHRVAVRCQLTGTIPVYQ